MKPRWTDWMLDEPIGGLHEDRRSARGERCRDTINCSQVSARIVPQKRVWRRRARVWSPREVRISHDKTLREVRDHHLISPCVLLSLSALHNGRSSRPGLDGRRSAIEEQVPVHARLEQNEIQEDEKHRLLDVGVRKGLAAFLTARSSAVGSR